MTLIDKSLQQHALINFMGAILQSPAAMATLHSQTTADGTPVPIEEGVRALAASLAAVALRDTSTTDLFQFPDGSAAGDALKLYLSVQESPQATAFEDALQEGELALNAAALITHTPEQWCGAAPGGDDVAFPGSGAEDGEARINDLIRAVALLLGELGRLERKVAAEQAYAAAAPERGEAVLPTDLH